ncbi:hypothetical protein MKD41_11530 [Lutibacter sp. A64]|uniref:hypothetical protein n=1 Tax=Lutibacter sp. A64 TaxID=2918526 RepID=UPI001F06D332|nr:hypothetical protein [Lutibacter sp. A64]UMB52963.1 hypothetical protein MKD41_11530 [Lutibacter sp. A64]
MGILKNENKNYLSDIVYHLEQLESDLLRIQMDNNRSFVLSKSLDIAIGRIKMIIKLVHSDPRFDWKVIQEEMDSSFKKDTSLTGFKILFDFKESKKPNRCLIPVTLTIKSDKNE